MQDDVFAARADSQKVVNGSRVMVFSTGFFYEVLGLQVSPLSELFGEWALSAVGDVLEAEVLVDL